MGTYSRLPMLIIVWIVVAFSTVSNQISFAQKPPHDPDEFVETLENKESQTAQDLEAPDESEQLKHIPGQLEHKQQEPAKTLADPLNRIRVLLVVDTKAKGDIGESVVADYKRMARTFNSIFENPAYPKLNGRMKGQSIGTVGSVTIKQIAQYFKKYPIQQDEALVFYYSGHGGVDPKLHGYHFMSFSSGDKLQNSNLVNLFQSSLVPFHPALTIFIFDDCSSFSEVTLPKVAPAGGGGREQLYVDLFLRSRGVVWINAASPGQAAWGGVMTPAFTATLLYGNLDGGDLWGSLFQQVRSGTEFRFAATKQHAKANDDIQNASNQTPILYRW